MRLGLCASDIPAYIRDDAALLHTEVNMVAMYTFADLNMGNYPPTNATALSRACGALVATPTPAGVAGFLSGYATAASTTNQAACFNLTAQLPAGAHATISAGDWSGVGTGLNGESWDYETCTLLVEQIGTNGVSDMFPAREWTAEWLQQHCAARFGVRPRPRALADLWGFDDLAGAGASRIIFTNGLNDWWSAGGITESINDELVAINMPNGAHHSDLSHEAPGPRDTPDVVAARRRGIDTLASWLRL